MPQAGRRQAVHHGRRQFLDSENIHAVLVQNAKQHGRVGRTIHGVHGEQAQPAALPRSVRDGAAAAGRTIALRANAGYFAGDLARAAAAEGMAFAIGAKRITSMWRALAGIAEDAW